MSLDVYLSISHLFFMASVLVTNKPETSGQPKPSTTTPSSPCSLRRELYKTKAAQEPNHNS